jgi:hypothetical protein
MKYVIQPPVVPRSVDGNHVQRFLNDAQDRAIATVVAADRTRALFSDVEAGAAEAGVLRHVAEGVRQCL